MNNRTSESTGSVFSPWDNPLDILSHQDYQLVLFLVNFVIMPILHVVGVPSNIISCVVFWRQGLGDRMNVCLLALSLVDLCFLLVSMVYCIGYYLGQVDPQEFGDLYDILLAFLSGANQGFRSASGCITMVIAVERCLCVVFPLKAATLISRRTMIAIMVFIVCFNQVALLTIPATFVVIKVQNGSSEFVIAYTDFYSKNSMFIDTIENIIMNSVLPFTTFLVTCLSTGLTVVKLRAAMTWRGQVSSSETGQGQHTALTKMLVIVSCAFILTNIPWVIFYLTTFFVEDFSVQGHYYNLFWTVAILTCQCSYVNSSVSFYVYFSRSTRFRRDVLTLFCCPLTSVSSDLKATRFS